MKTTAVILRSAGDDHRWRRLKQSTLFRSLRPLISRLWVPWDIWQWRRRGKSGPLPHTLKQRLLRHYGRRFGARILVETGTYMGDMVRAMMPSFDHIYSIELDPALYQRAAKCFRANPKVTIVGGDSAKRLPEVMAEVGSRCLVWLDSHYSGGITARGDVETPIVSELKGIFQDRKHDHIILIDDARCFVGEHDYPTIEELRTLIKSFRPEYVVEVVDDVIRAYHTQLPQPTGAP